MSDRAVPVSTSGGGHYHYHQQGGHGFHHAAMEPQPLGLPLPFSSKQSPNIFSVTSANPIQPQPVLVKPSQATKPLPDDTQNDSEDVSDWEHEVDPDTGSLFYVETFSSPHHESKQKSAGLKNSCSAGPSGAAAAAPVKLSRMVRRRESKRDRLISERSSSGPTAAGSKQAAAAAGRNGALSAVNERHHNSGGAATAESSDNDSSTYGQVSAVVKWSVIEKSGKFFSIFL